MMIALTVDPSRQSGTSSSACRSKLRLTTESESTGLLGFIGSPCRKPTLESGPHASTSPRIQSVLRSWQPRRSTLSSEASAGGTPARRTSALVSLILLFGCSQSTLPRRSAGSARAAAASPSSVPTSTSLSSDSNTLGARRSFMSVSPSSGFVFTQHSRPVDDLRRSRSAGKASWLSTRTTSPSRTSAHVPSSHSAALTLPPSSVPALAPLPPPPPPPPVARRMVTSWPLTRRSALWRAMSSFAISTRSTSTMRASGPQRVGSPFVIEIAGTSCRKPMHRK
mmetsp:Transcript_7063/g.13838  ORF Transcript_7063/g.13838 Transcript_7063/m.13838 type:complete len:281 (+) Transcript_7063:3708-4550(+)